MNWFIIVLIGKTIIEFNKNCEDVFSSLLVFIKGEWSAIESHLCSDNKRISALELHLVNFNIY